MTVTPIGSGVPSYGIFDTDNRFTFLTSGITDKTGEGSIAVSLDTTAAMTVKPAADGDTIVGQLYKWEDRTQLEGITVGTVQLGHSLVLFPVKNGATVAVGDTVVGGGAGTVRSLVNMNIAFNVTGVPALTTTQAAALTATGIAALTVKEFSVTVPNLVVEVAPNGRTGFVSVLLN